MYSSLFHKHFYFLLFSDHLLNFDTVTCFFWNNSNIFTLVLFFLSSKHVLSFSILPSSSLYLFPSTFFHQIYCYSLLNRTLFLKYAASSNNMPTVIHVFLPCLTTNIPFYFFRFPHQVFLGNSYRIFSFIYIFAYS